MSTLGNQFLRAVVDAQDTAAFRRTQRRLFVEAEVPVYDAVMAHVMAHGRVPSLSALSVAGVTLPEARHDEPVSWFAERLRNRAAWGAMNERHPAFVQAMRDKDVVQAEAVAAEMLAEARAMLGAGGSYSSFAAEAEAIGALYHSAKMHTGLMGVTMRWPTLNALTDGAQGGDVIALVGRPGEGKSWNLQELALAAHEDGLETAVVSMEMGVRQLCRRMIARKIGANPRDIKRGTLPHWAEGDLFGAIAELTDAAPMHVLAGDMQKEVGGIESMLDDRNVSALYVDAAYLLSPSARMSNGVSKWETIGQVIKELKQLAVRRDIPVFITVQFNRNQKRKASREMDLGDIAGSDSIPQDCSIVVGIRRGPAPFDEVIREHHVLKNREGDAGKYNVNFRFQPVNFDEVELEVTENGNASAGAPSASTDWMV